MSIRFSIIIPVYNGEMYIHETINSILSQNFKNYEIIIIDGCSNDNTIKIINSFGDKIHQIISEKDFGLNHAVNKGILAAKGEFIAWMNADDFYLTDALNKVDNFLKINDDVDMIYGEAAHVDSNGKIIDWHGAINFNSDLLFHGRNYIPCQATFFKKSTLAYIGLLDTSLKWCGDWDLWKRFAKSEKFKIIFLNEKIAAWRIHANTITSGNYSSKQLVLQNIENIKSIRKYSNKIITINELKHLIFILVGILRLRTPAKKIRELLKF